MNRAEDLIEHEHERVRTLEQTLKILKTATSPEGEVDSTSTAIAGQKADEGADEDDGGSKLEGLEMASLSVIQRRKVMTLRNKRERLEREKAKLGLSEA